MRSPFSGRARHVVCILAAAGAHRVRVAVSTLRKLGLANLIVTTGEGYALDARVPLVFV